MRISDWSSDVVLFRSAGRPAAASRRGSGFIGDGWRRGDDAHAHARQQRQVGLRRQLDVDHEVAAAAPLGARFGCAGDGARSEEHTSELQSLMRISYAVFCLKKKNKNNE